MEPISSVRRRFLCNSPGELPQSVLLHGSQSQLCSHSRVDVLHRNFLCNRPAGQFHPCEILRRRCRRPTFRDDRQPRARPTSAPTVKDAQTMLCAAIYSNAIFVGARLLCPFVLVPLMLSFSDKHRSSLLLFVVIRCNYLPHSHYLQCLHDFRP